MDELYYATSNRGKFVEVAEYLKRHAPQLELLPFDADIPEIQTMDQMAIAMDKATKVYQMLQRPLLVDDAAIYFEKYTLFPGTLSKFVVKGLGVDGVSRLIDHGDKAYYLLYMIFVQADGQKHIFEGRCDGTLIKPDVFDADPQLPYDSFFVPEGQHLTCAKMWNQREKYEDCFYRLRALKKFVAWYQSNEQF